MPKAHGHIVSVLLTKKQYKGLRSFTRAEHRAISSYIRHLIVKDLTAHGFDVEEPTTDDDEDDDEDESSGETISITA